MELAKQSYSVLEEKLLDLWMYQFTKHPLSTHCAPDAEPEVEHKTILDP